VGPSPEYPVSNPTEGLIASSESEHSALGTSSEALSVPAEGEAA